MTPNGAIPCKLDTHVVKLSSGANSSTHTGGYTNNGACDKPVKNLENINNPLLGTATNITSAIIFKKIDNSKTFLWLFHVVNKYPVSGWQDIVRSGIRQVTSFWVTFDTGIAELFVEVFNARITADNCYLRILKLGCEMGKYREVGRNITGLMAGDFLCLREQ